MSDLATNRLEDRRTVCTLETRCGPEGLQMNKGLARQRTLTLCSLESFCEINIISFYNMSNHFTFSPVLSVSLSDVQPTKCQPASQQHSLPVYFQRCPGPARHPDPAAVRKPATSVAYCLICHHICFSVLFFSLSKSP